MIIYFPAKHNETTITSQNDMTTVSTSATQTYADVFYDLVVFNFITPPQ